MTIQKMRGIFMLMVIVLGLFSSCGSTENKVDETSNNDLIVGSWNDTSAAKLHFTLLEDGTASSDNMATLVYKNWRIEDNKIIFTVESKGNGVSTTEDEAYEIKKLTEQEMILKNGDAEYKYVKSK